MARHVSSYILGILIFSKLIFAQAPNLGITNLPDASPVPTGTNIGFTITVTNSSAAGTGTAINVNLANFLPVGFNWSIDPPYTGPGLCDIQTGFVAFCHIGDLAPGAQATIHVQAPTFAPPDSSEGTYTNIASLTADNEPGPLTNSASITVLPPPAPHISVTNTPDSSPVLTGLNIGFTITLSNSSAAGTGTAFNAHFDDILPSGPGLSWTINPAYTGPGACSIGPGSDLFCNLGNLTPGAQAQIHVQSPTTAPPGSSAGTYVNQVFFVYNSLPPTGSSVATIVVNNLPPTLTKSFGKVAIPLNGTTSLNFSITNPNGVLTTGVSFSDTLPSGLIVSTPNGLTTTCTGTISSTAGSNSIVLAGATIASNSSCTISVNVTGVAAGIQKNTTGPINSNESGPGAVSNTTALTVVASPTLTKTFGAATVLPNGNTTLSFTITNPNGNEPLSGIGFTDNLPAGLVVANPNSLSGSCGSGAITATAGSSNASLLDATLVANASCTFSLNVTALSEGVKNNTTSPITSTEGGNGLAASATIRVALPPTLTKAFADSQLQLFGPSNSTALSFTLTNPNTSTTLTGLAFTDTLPAGLVVSTSYLVGSCGGGTITAAAGTNFIVLSGATLAPGASCGFSVDVSGIAIGVQANTTSTVSSNEALPGDPATASTSVNDLLFFWFFAA